MLKAKLIYIFIQEKLINWECGIISRSKDYRFYWYKYESHKFEGVQYFKRSI